MKLGVEVEPVTSDSRAFRDFIKVDEKHISLVGGFLCDAA